MSIDVYNRLLCLTARLGLAHTSHAVLLARAACQLFAIDQIHQMFKPDNMTITARTACQHFAFNQIEQMSKSFCNQPDQVDVQA